MIAHLIEGNKDLFCPKEDNEKLFDLEVPYLIAIGALTYLKSCTRFNISFSINFLERYSFAPTCRCWLLRKKSKYLLLASLLSCRLAKSVLLK